MDDIRTEITSGAWKCIECQNENNQETESLKENAVVECAFCGIEYRIVGIDENGTIFTIEILEEEK